MLRMKPYSPSTRIAVRDSIDEDLSDIDDDVFIRDGKASSEEKGLKRPLMAPRRRNGSSPTSRPSKTKKTVAAILRQRNRCWKFCEPFCYAFAALIVLVALIFLAAFFLAMFPVALQKIKMLFRDSNFVGHSFGARYGGDVPMEYNQMFSNEMTPCTQLRTVKTWSKGFSRLSTESPVRKADVNGDGIVDIIFGYGVDDSVQYDQGIPKCEIERPGGYREMVYCGGGLLAMDGSTGTTVWQRWTTFIVFSLYCNADLNGDSVIDCVASGRGGHIVAVNGKNGELLWHIDTDAVTYKPTQIDLYTVNGVRDVDGDSVPDVLAAFIEERERSVTLTVSVGRISIISGRTGKIMRTIDSPFQEELYVPLQVITKEDGNDMILAVTGGQNSAGGIYLISLSTFMDESKQNEFTVVFRNPTAGFMVPPILVDINDDSTDDIVAAMFNSTVFAFDGKSYTTLWRYVFPDSESISSIIPGHYNHDNVTDFMVKYNCGPGFPIYYYSQTQVINGKDGTALLDKMINDSGGSNSLLGGLSISQAYGGDFYLHWQTQCRGKNDSKEPYQFVPDSNVMAQSRADTCMLRYNASTVLQLHAISRHIQSPGVLIVSTDDLLLQLNQTELKQLERQMAVSPLKHPKMQKKIQTIANSTNASSSGSGSSSTVSVVRPTLKTMSPHIETKSNRKLTPNRPVALKNRKKIIGAEGVNHSPYAPHVLVPNINNNVNGDNNYEKPLFNEQTNQMDVRLPSPVENGMSENLEDEYIANRQKQLQKFILKTMNENRNQYMMEQMDGQPPDTVDYGSNFNLPDEYDETIGGQRKPAYEMGSRDVRSKVDGPDIDTDSINNTNDLAETNAIIDNIATDLLKQRNIVETPNMHPNTLWDLELEKENKDAIKEAKRIEDDKRRRRRRQLSIDMPLINQNLLAFITSPGVLLAPLDAATELGSSTLDFVFILNVRESELYPPLLMAEDLKCVQERLNNYATEFTANLQAIETKLLKECLNERLPNLAPHKTQFESQIVVTRISITCTCDAMKTGEKCSTLNRIDKQHWTEFMGNLNNGIY